MTQLRRWQLQHNAPYSAEIAADARLSVTDYTNDQVWRLQLGTGDSPALALQTRYGGRAGLVSIVPMWHIDGRTVYEAVGYTTPPVITAFAPGFLQTQARLTPNLGLRAEYWAMSSHATGARFTLANTSASPVQLRLNLFGHVGMSGKEQRIHLLALPNGTTALDLGRIGNLQPVVLLEGGSTDPTDTGSPKIGTNLTVPANGRVSVRWVVAGEASAQASVKQAQHWLGQNWAEAFRAITEASSAIPTIETGDVALDATIAASYRQLVQSFLRPTTSLPHASLVGTRQPDRGYSARGDGSDYPRSWLGQTPMLSYLAGLAVAPIAPEWAQGLVLNTLAVQREDGWIDWKPGLGGQKQGLLCLPILARLTWGIFQYTEDDSFLKATFPGLRRFLDCWLNADRDADGDGHPEWQAEPQTGYPYFPTFAINQPWGQGADIGTVESPDLAAYLLSEALSLREIAFYLRDDEAHQQLEQQVATLAEHLESLWHDDRYAYRDRDSHTTAAAVTVLDDGNGAEEHFPALTLSPPARLVVRISGGLAHVPNMTLHLQGADADGQPITESVDAKSLVWTNSRGVYTSRAVFSQIDRVWCERLINVYRIRVRTLDTSRLDINALLPLWAVEIPDEHEAALIALTQSDAFLRPNGVTMTAATDPQFDPANERGSGGVWPFWFTLIGEGLIEHGRPELAADLLGRLLPVQVSLLTEQKQFSEFYHSDEPQGLGESGHVGGIVPLHLFMRALGVRVISAGRVWAGGPYSLPAPVTLTQHGVRVERSADGTRITFPSGTSTELPADAPLQAVTDPAYTPKQRATTVSRSTPTDDLFEG
jgi:hypothetical protein